MYLRAAVVTALTTTSLALVATVTTTTATATPAGCATALLAKAQPAAAVAKRQPAKFQAAAKRNHASVTAYTKLARDKDLWLDRCGKGFYVEQKVAGAATAQSAAASTPTSTVPLADTFKLESRPGSNRTIYLDFLGATVTGTAWNGSYGTSLVAEPYSIDTTIDTNFSDAELTEIQKAWQVVAEDYAAFDVNVTTRDLGVAAIDRTSSSDLVYGSHVLMTNGGTIYTSCGCGGIAYVNVYNMSGTNHLYYQPAWVFSKGTTTNGKYMGEAAAHEVGHNFGLNHDGTSTSSYYAGSTPWAPIMGSSYSQPVSQWSAGEYPGANNSQDDLAVIATGAPLLADDHANGAAGATPLTSGSPVNGVITTRTDTDAFTFTGSGATSVSVTGAAGFPDLDVQLTVLDSSGATVAVVDPPSARVSAYVASGLNASWSATLPSSGATYTLVVDGVGTGDPSTAGKYSDYASTGSFQISLTTTPPSGGTPLGVTASTPPPATVGSSYTATPVSASGGVAPYTFSATSLPAGLTIAASTGTISGTPSAAGSYAPTVTVTDSMGASGAQSMALTVNPAPVPATQVADQSFSGTSGTALSKQLVATGGDGSYAWTASGVPAGLSVSASGLLSGTPSAAGTFTFSATATSAGTSATGTITLTVAAAPTAPLAFSTSATLTGGKVGTAYSTSIKVTGGIPAWTWVRTSGTLPAGLTLTWSGQTATLSGTPTKAGKSSFSLKVTDGAGATVTRTFSVNIRK
jgi:hypothetical protein